MRPNGSPPRSAEEPAQGWERVTSMARWLARRRRPEGARPRVSVVMPVYNAEATLAECLTRLCASTFPDFEIVLVDDGSTDQTRAIAANFPVRVVPTKGRGGPAAARNVGASAAEGEILFFLDSDVMVRPDTVERVVDGLGRGDVDALVGVQAADMRHRDLPSQYKNLWMRWTYMRKTGNVGLFYTTAAAIRRETFLRAGGFDQSYTTPDVEDQAFGQKLKQLGVRVRIEPSLEVEHVKHYSLRGLLVTDFKRAVSLARLNVRHRSELGQNSVPASYMASVPTATAGVAAIGAGAALGMTALLVFGAAALATSVALNNGFLRAIGASEGWGRAVAAIPVLWLELVVAGVGAGVGIVTYVLGSRY